MGGSGHDPDGRDLVLKVGWWHEEAAHEADGLAAWSGRGAVLMLDAHASGQTSALLVERCRPGTSMSDVLPEAEQDVVIAGLLQRLWITPPASHRFRPLQDMCSVWADEFSTRLATAPEACDPGLARAAVDLLRVLPASADRQVLLCTDLHAENVLAAQREPWLVIDPKPYVGDPAYDPVQHLLNCDQRLLADPADLAHRMADQAGLDRDRVRVGCSPGPCRSPSTSRGFATPPSASRRPPDRAQCPSGLAGSGEDRRNGGRSRYGCARRLLRRLPQLAGRPPAARPSPSGGRRR
jgi:streptomycin 6-kinase